MTSRSKSANLPGCMLLFLFLLGTVSAQYFFESPLPTATTESELHALSGVTPLPTTPPTGGGTTITNGGNQGGYPLSKLCGYVRGDPAYSLTCADNMSCSVDGSVSRFGCCSGTGFTNCHDMKVQCFDEQNRRDLKSCLDSEGCTKNPHHLICGNKSTDNPHSYCATYNIAIHGKTYRHFGCATAPFSLDIKTAPTAPLPINVLPLAASLTPSNEDHPAPTPKISVPVGPQQTSTVPATPVFTPAQPPIVPVMDSTGALQLGSVLGPTPMTGTDAWTAASSSARSTLVWLSWIGEDQSTRRMKTTASSVSTAVKTVDWSNRNSSTTAAAAATTAKKGGAVGRSLDGVWKVFVLGIWGRVLV